MERNKRRELYYSQIIQGWYLMTSEFKCVLGVSALHYSTGNWEVFWTLASAHALHLTTYYLCPSISGVCQKFQGFPGGLEVVQEFGSQSVSVVKRDEHRGQE